MLECAPGNLKAAAEAAAIVEALTPRGPRDKENLPQGNVLQNRVAFPLRQEVGELCSSEEQSRRAIALLTALDSPNVGRVQTNMSHTRLKPLARRRSEDPVSRKLLLSMGTTEETKGGRFVRTHSIDSVFSQQQRPLPPLPLPASLPDETQEQEAKSKTCGRRAPTPRMATCTFSSPFAPLNRGVSLRGEEDDSDLPGQMAEDEVEEEEEDEVRATLIHLGSNQERFELVPGRTFTFGRHKGNSRRLEDSRVSSRHLTLHSEAASGHASSYTFFLQDHSHNGTWLRRGNSRFMLKGNRMPIYGGDVISVVASFVCAAHGDACTGGHEDGGCTPKAATSPAVFRFTTTTVVKPLREARGSSEEPENLVRPACVPSEATLDEPSPECDASEPPCLGPTTPRHLIWPAADSISGKPATPQVRLPFRNPQCRLCCVHCLVTAVAVPRDLGRCAS